MWWSSNVSGGPYLCLILHIDVLCSVFCYIYCLSINPDSWNVLSKICWMQIVAIHVINKTRNFQHNDHTNAHQNRQRNGSFRYKRINRSNLTEVPWHAGLTTLMDRLTPSSCAANSDMTPLPSSPVKNYFIDAYLVLFYNLYWIRFTPIYYSKIFRKMC